MCNPVLSWMLQICCKGLDDGLKLPHSVRVLVRAFPPVLKVECFSQMLQEQRLIFTVCIWYR